MTNCMPFHFTADDSCSRMFNMNHSNRNIRTYFLAFSEQRKRRLAQPVKRLLLVFNSPIKKILKYTRILRRISPQHDAITMSHVLVKARVMQSFIEMISIKHEQIPFSFCPASSAPPSPSPKRILRLFEIQSTLVVAVTLGTSSVIAEVISSQTSSAGNLNFVRNSECP